MKVKTATDRAKTARKMVAELLLTDQPAREVAHDPDFEFWKVATRIVGDLACRLVGQQLRHHARGPGAVGGGLDLHAGRRIADAACRQHALALDLDHADPQLPSAR